MVAEWVQWVLGLLIPLLVGHGAWITVRVLRLGSTVDGNGGDGLRGKVKDLDDWRHGNPPYGGPQHKNLESRCRHDCANEIQVTIDKLEAAVERRRRPHRREDPSA